MSDSQPATTVPRPLSRRVVEPHCRRCGHVAFHWPGCPAIGSDDRPTFTAP